MEIKKSVKFDVNAEELNACKVVLQLLLNIEETDYDVIAELIDNYTEHVEIGIDVIVNLLDEIIKENN